MTSKKVCSIEGCAGAVVARTWCRFHYGRWERRGDPLWYRPTPDELFWSHVRPTGFCWEWTGSASPKGYGQTHRDGRNQQAHRVSYELLVGKIPDGLHIDHLCRNPNCVNPDHLEPVTPQENSRRTRRIHCRNGHLMTVGNLYKCGNGRRCRTCDLETHYAKYRESHVIRLRRIPPEVALAVYARGNSGTQRQVASEFGISPTMVYRIRNNLGWFEGRRA